MKLPDSNIETSSGGVLDSNYFGIGDAGLILNILRTKIYTDPIKAICREITCNARDAHREVGTPERPIEIEFPSAFQKDLRIKDYGPGIDPSRMRDIFIKFGSSTKRDSNVQTGGFGIGSKSVYSYTDIFSVITIVNGIKYTYTAYIDESQMGKMDLMKKENTNDSNGTTIIIPIKQEDRQRFINLIVETTKHWEVKPILKGDHRTSYPQFSFAFKGDGWAYPDDSSMGGNRYYHSSYNSYAIVDGVEYTILPDSIVDASALHRAILNSGFHIYFDVGELTLSASRDNLYYDNKTQKLLIDRLNDLTKDLVKIVSDKIASASSYTEACKQYRDAKALFNRANLMTHIQGVTWKGHKIRERVTADDIGSWTNVKTYSWNTYNNKVTSSNRNNYIDFMNDNVLLFKHDLKTKSVPIYLTEWLLSQDRTRTIQVIATHDPPHSVEYKEAVSRAERMQKPAPKVEYDTELLELLELKSLQKKLDEIPKEEKKRKARKSIKKEDDQIFGYDLSETFANAKFRTRSTAYDADKGGVFVEVDYKTQNFQSEGNLITLNKLILANKFLEEDIVGFSAHRIKQLAKKGKGWKTFNRAIQDKMAEMKLKYSVATLTKAANNSQYFWQHYVNNYNLRFLEEKFERDEEGNLIDDLSCFVHQDLSDNLFLKWYEESNKHLKFLRSCKDFRTFLSKFEKENDTLKGLDDNIRRSSYNKPLNVNSECRDLHNKIIRRYPLLQNLTNATGSDILHYINLVDRFEKRNK